MKDVFELLKKDHQKVKKLFKEYEASGERAFKKRRDLADTIFMELENHAKLEEEIFYPAVEEEAGDEGLKLVAEAYEEHRLVRQLTRELRKLKAGDEDFEAKFKVLRENVEHHIEEEEDELFPEARKALSDEIEEITEEVEERKEDLMVGHH